MSLKEKLISVFEKLPENKQEEIIDFANYLEEISQDVTDYLFGTEANRIHLNQVINNIEAGENLMKISLNDLEKGNLPDL